MKLILLCIFAVFALSEARHRRDIKETVAKLKEKFPKAEWEAFYGKLTETLGSEKGNFEKELEKHKGNMDLTLVEFKDKLGESYPVINEHWATVKDKWGEVSGTLDDKTVGEVLEWFKKSVQGSVGDISEDRVREWWDSAKNYVLAYWNQMQKEGARRSKYFW